MCERLPDCPHFHLVFSLPAELWEFFEHNYRHAAAVFFRAAAETLKKFQKNNWGCEGGFLAVLHTWGSALNWHPHLHVLVSGGGVGRAGRWKSVKGHYSFPVKLMSKVFSAIMLRGLEELDGDAELRWPAGLDTVERRRDWRVMLAGRSWNIYSKSTLGNTRAVVRYLARYTSRIAISNRRLTGVDPVARTVSFQWTDYRHGAKAKEMTLSGAAFLRRFARHLVPKAFRRVRYYGLAAGRSGRFTSVPGAPQDHLARRSEAPQPLSCPQCRSTNWRVQALYRALAPASAWTSIDNRFSLPLPRAGP